MYQTFCPVLRFAFTQRDKDLYLHCFDEYPSFDVVIKDLGGKVEYAEFVSDKTEVEFENVVINGKNYLRLHLPVIQPDPYDTVIRIVLK